ncbi:LysR family transcriptional regulator [Siminovitchia sediminis]|uniref:LysR family transcriptional regulator n=1 Tax=Siminovitchia sediminis TaxID=1274353 RepID=A0ABW4KIE0_9BACI
MDLRTIKSFKAIVEYGSFQRAAEKLNYAQSTITSHIKKLESGLGVVLFERGNHLRLTEAGQMLNEKSELLLQSFDNLKSSMDELIDGESENIRIGVMEPMASYRLPPLLKIFNKQYPKVQLSLQIHGSKVLTDMVIKDEIDAAICAAPTNRTGFQFEAVFSEKFVLLAPEEHPLANKEKVYLADLHDEKLVMTNPSCPFRSSLSI